MAANLHLVIIAVLALFGSFVGALAYGQWATWGVALAKAPAGGRLSVDNHPASASVSRSP